MTADSIVTSAQIDVYPSDRIRILGYDPRSLNVAKLRPHRWAFSGASHLPNLAMPSAGRNGAGGGVWVWGEITKDTDPTSDNLQRPLEKALGRTRGAFLRVLGKYISMSL